MLYLIPNIFIFHHLHLLHFPHTLPFPTIFVEIWEPFHLGFHNFTPAMPQRFLDNSLLCTKFFLAKKQWLNVGVCGRFSKGREKGILTEERWGRAMRLVNKECIVWPCASGQDMLGQSIYRILFISSTQGASQMIIRSSTLVFNSIMPAR